MWEIMRVLLVRSLMLFVLGPVLLTAAASNDGGLFLPVGGCVGVVVRGLSRHVLRREGGRGRREGRERREG